VLSFLLLSGCAAASVTAPTAAPSPPAAAPPRVVVISVDGLRPDAIDAGAAPGIDALRRRGAYARDARTVLPSNTLPAHVSMLSGYEPSAHGIGWDEYMPQKGAIRVPTIFGAARAAGLRSVLVAGKEKFNHFRDAGGMDACILAGRGDDDVANEAIVQAGTAFDLLVVHLPGVDLAGHARGWMSEGYLAQVGATDRAIGRLLAALPPQATVILTADHGGRTEGHGSAAPLDICIPWMIAGPSVVPGPLAVPVRTTDTAATAAHLLGLRLSADAHGRPVLEAFSQRVEAAAR
jgi:predicted AlkP superfamily pyrophosphatase or phosphodiesterase